MGSHSRVVVPLHRKFYPIETRQGSRISVTKLPSDAEQAMSTGWHMGEYYSGKDPWAHLVKNLPLSTLSRHSDPRSRNGRS
jgi:hypothetical protein